MTIYLAILNLIHADRWTNKYRKTAKAFSQILIANVPKRNSSANIIALNLSAM
jgi:hypothetical protein